MSARRGPDGPATVSPPSFLSPTAHGKAVAVDGALVTSFWTAATAAGTAGLHSLGGEAFDLALAALLYFFVERWRPAVARQRFLKSDFFTELGYPFLNVAVTTPIAVGWLAPRLEDLLRAVAPYHLLAPVAEWLPLPGQVLLALLVIDVAVYVEHRFLAHGPLWHFHALHHMTPEPSWLTASRVHPVNATTIVLTSVVVQTLFGFDGVAMVMAGSIGASLGAWQHANMNFSLPRPLAYLLVTPRFHRWHHASDRAAVDKNFCLIFPFLDLLGGSYYCPDRLPERYGLWSAAEPSSEATAPGSIPAGFWAQMAYPFGRHRTA